MSSQKVESIKIPPFDKENYSLWKKKMTLFIRAANPLYMGILENGLFVPQKLISESVTETGEKIPQKFMPKDPSDFSDTEKDKVAFGYKLSTYSCRIFGHCNVESSHQLQQCQTNVGHH